MGGTILTSQHILYLTGPPSAATTVDVDNEVMHTVDVDNEVIHIPLIWTE